MWHFGRFSNIQSHIMISPLYTFHCQGCWCYCISLSYSLISIFLLTFIGYAPMMLNFQLHTPMHAMFMCAYNYVLKLSFACYVRMWSLIMYSWYNYYCRVSHVRSFCQVCMFVFSPVSLPLLYVHGIIRICSVWFLDIRLSTCIINEFIF